MFLRIASSITIAQSLLFIFALISLGSGSAVLWHAAVGIPLLFDSPSSPVVRAFLHYRASTVPAINFVPPASKEIKKAPEVMVKEFKNPSSHVFIEVPFVSQAPLGDWSEPYQDACEEASVLMAMAWVRGQNWLDPREADLEILGQMAYEIFNFGYHRDTSLVQTLKLFRRYYGYAKVRASYDIAISDIKRELVSGNLVIVPAAGTALNNPYYASPPPYHMVVVTGYDDLSEEFIVNDPGTRRGKNYRYSYEKLWGAIHDWTGSEDTLLKGAKGMIVVLPDAKRP